MASTIADLEDSLLIDILNRLPTAKFAVQCELVCKKWHSLISTPYFRRRFLDRHAQEPNPFLVLVPHRPVIRVGDSDPTSDREYHILKLSDEQNDGAPIPRSVGLDGFNDLIQVAFDLVATYDDLILLKAKLQAQSERSYYIYNPITSQLLDLPPIEDRYSSDGHIIIEGLVCVATSNGCSYKVVHGAIVVADENNTVMMAQIFSSETKEWTESFVQLGKDFTVESGSSVLGFLGWQGVMHWVMEDAFIIAYDPNNNPQECRCIKLPPDLRYCPVLGVCKGSIQLLEVCPTNNCNCSVKVWELENHGESSGTWALKQEGNTSDLEQRSNIEGIPPDFPFVGWQDGFPLALHPNDSSKVFMTCFERKMFTCDLENNVLELTDELARNFELERMVLERAGNLLPRDYSRIRMLLQQYGPVLLLPCWPTILPQLSENASC